jgi:hypothetical protein
MIFRIVIVASLVATLSGAWWLAVNGVGGESSDLDRSIRTGSGGNTFTNTSVK